MSRFTVLHAKVPYYYSLFLGLDSFSPDDGWTDRWTEMVVRVPGAYPSRVRLSFVPIRFEVTVRKVRDEKDLRLLIHSGSYLR